MPEQAERKSLTEPLDLQRKIEDALADRRPLPDEYPYFSPDYEVPFTHVGTEKQLFVDNFMLDWLDGVERRFPTPERRVVLEMGELPWERTGNPVPLGALHDPEDGLFKLWYNQPFVYQATGVGNVCYAESADGLSWVKPLSTDCLPFDGHDKTNIVRHEGGTVVLNPDTSDPARKFLMLLAPQGAGKSGRQAIHDGASRLAGRPALDRYRRGARARPPPRAEHPLGRRDSALGGLQWTAPR